MGSEVRLPSMNTDAGLSSEMRGVAGLGEMSERIRLFDWTSTSLGPLELWPASLKTVVNLALSSVTPTSICWGAEMSMIYNDSYREILGAKHPQALGQSVRFVWQDIWHHIGERYEAVLLSGESTMREEAQIPIERPGGTQEFYWTYSLSPVFDEDKVAGIFNVGQNVTDSVNAMNALIETDERLRLALSSDHMVGTWDWYIQKDLVFADPRFASLYGADPTRSAGGFPLSDYLKNIHPGDLSLVQGAIARAIESGDEFSCEYRLIQETGMISWVSARGRCVYGDDGRPERFPGLSIDITARKEAEAFRRRNQVWKAESMKRRYSDWVQVLPSAAVDWPKSSSPMENLTEILALMLKEAAQPESVRTYVERAREQMSLLAEMISSLRLSEEVAFTPVDLFNVADAALRLQDQTENRRGLHLVAPGGAHPESELYLTQVLNLVWDVLGDVLESLTQDRPVPLKQSLLYDHLS